MTGSFSRYEHRRLRLLAKYCEGKTVLDLGYAAFPNPYFTGFHRVGLDLNRPVRKQSDNADTIRYEEEVVGNVADVLDMFNGRVFDNVVAGELIEHVENPYQFLRTMLPLLSRGGRLVLSTPNPLSFPVVLCELVRSKRYFYTKEHVHYFCPRWVERMLEFTGYRVLRVKGVGLWNPLLALPCPVAASYQIVYVAMPAE